MRHLYRNKWFILMCLWSVFLFFTGTKVMAAGTDSQLAVILGKGLEAFQVFLDWLLEMWKAL